MNIKKEKFVDKDDYIYKEKSKRRNKHSRSRSFSPKQHRKHLDRHRSYDKRDYDRKHESSRTRSRSPRSNRTGHRDEDREYKPVRIKQEPDPDFPGHLRSEHPSRDARRENQNVTHSNQRYQKEYWGKQEHEKKPKSNEKQTTATKGPTLELSGALLEDANTFKGVVIKYSEPPDARKPTVHWRLYPFKGDTPLPKLHMHRQSGYLIGRERKVCDLPMDHPSISKQHAVFQFRQIEVKENNRKKCEIKPYIIDLESGNGTFLNNEKIEPSRYIELKEKDVLKFGFSTREYVVLTDNPDDI